MSTFVLKKNDKSKVFIAKQFNNIQPFYKKPIDSLKLGIGIVDELSNNLVTIDIEKSEFLKYVILSNPLGNIAFPILHSDFS